MKSQFSSECPPVSTINQRTMMLIDEEISVSKDVVAHLTDPDFCDVKIVANDGEIQANKTILSIRSQYFRSMFSSRNNFVESQVGSVKMPYARSVLDKMVLYLYSGKLDCDQMSLRALMDLLELFNLMNLSAEYEKVESYTLKNIKKEKFNLSDCLKDLEDSSNLGLKNVGEYLLAHLGENFNRISQLKEIGFLSEGLLIRLLEEKKQFSDVTILRFKTFVTWLKVNSMDDDMKVEVLQTLDFNHFTTKELASDVRKSGLYQIEQIIGRMEQLFEMKDYVLEVLVTDKRDVEIEKDRAVKSAEKIDKENYQLRSDMKIVKSNLNTGENENYWNSCIPSEVKNRYRNL